MKRTLGQVRDGAGAIAAAMAAARSARNRSTRAARVDEADSRRSAQRYKRARAREDRERERAMNRRFRVQVPEHERPRSRGATPHKLYYRMAGQVMGTRITDGSRGGSGVRSIHFAVTARGFASVKGRRWRSGEGERAAQYITREEALEGGKDGWWSTIAADRNELVAFHRASEAVERHDRANANVYVSEIISLPAPLSVQGRREAVRDYCRYFDVRGLPYTVALHLPDPNGDGRNHHCHIIYSLRPARRLGPYDWEFAVAKLPDVNTPDGIMTRRKLMVDAINTALEASGSAQRYTHLSNRARGLGAPQPKQGQEQTWAVRRLAAAEAGYARLIRLKAAADRLREGLGILPRVAAAAKIVAERLVAGRQATGTGLDEQEERLGRSRTRLMARLAKQRIRATMRADALRLAAIKAEAIITLHAAHGRLQRTYGEALDTLGMRVAKRHRLLTSRARLVSGLDALSRIGPVHRVVQARLVEAHAELAPGVPTVPTASMPHDGTPAPALAAATDPAGRIATARTLAADRIGTGTANLAGSNALDARLATAGAGFARREARRLALADHARHLATAASSLPAPKPSRTAVARQLLEGLADLRRDLPDVSTSRAAMRTALEAQAKAIQASRTATRQRIIAIAPVLRPDGRWRSEPPAAAETPSSAHVEPAVGTAPARPLPAQPRSSPSLPSPLPASPAPSSRVPSPSVVLARAAMAERAARQAATREVARIRAVRERVFARLSAPDVGIRLADTGRYRVRKGLLDDEERAALGHPDFQTETWARLAELYAAKRGPAKADISPAAEPVTAGAAADAPAPSADDEGTSVLGMAQDARSTREGR